MYSKFGTLPFIQPGKPQQNAYVERLNQYQLNLVGCNYRLEVSDYSKEILERLLDWKESV